MTPLLDVTRDARYGARLLLRRGSSAIAIVTLALGMRVGVRQVTDRLWLVSFMKHDFGYFDDETCRLEPIDNPFNPRVFSCLRNELSPIYPEWTQLNWR